jgi:type I restriction enzyme S subunit
MDAVLSIEPSFARKILSGEKRYEFRRSSFADHAAVEFVYLYASAPEQRIVGAFTTTRVVEAQPETLWDRFGDAGGVDRERFFDYFEGADTGYAICVDEAHEFEMSLDPTEQFEDFSIPVSFCYLNDTERETLRDRLAGHDGTAQSPPLARYTEE